MAPQKEKDVEIDLLRTIGKPALRALAGAGFGSSPSSRKSASKNFWLFTEWDQGRFVCSAKRSVQTRNWVSSYEVNESQAPAALVVCADGYRLPVAPESLEETTLRQ
jgi:hypothetical protein